MTEPFKGHPFTLNVDDGDGFTCLACGHWLHERFTEHGDSHDRGYTRFGYLHGTKPFSYCPACGSLVLTRDRWMEIYPGDRKKTTFEIETEFANGR